MIYPSERKYLFMYVDNVNVKEKPLGALRWKKLKQASRSHLLTRVTISSILLSQAYFTKFISESFHYLTFHFLKHYLVDWTDKD